MLGNFSLLEELSFSRRKKKSERNGMSKSMTEFGHSNSNRRFQWNEFKFEQKFQ